MGFGDCFDPETQRLDRCCTTDASSPKDVAFKLCLWHNATNKTKEAAGVVRAGRQPGKLYVLADPALEDAAQRRWRSPSYEDEARVSLFGEFAAGNYSVTAEFPGSPPQNVTKACQPVTTTPSSVLACTARCQCDRPIRSQRRRKLSTPIRQRRPE